MKAIISVIGLIASIDGSRMLQQLGGTVTSISCDANEELKLCGTACPRKCGDADAEICLAVCQQNVCRCKDGYVLDQADGECIPEEECPTEEPMGSTESPCGDNEELQVCGTACPRKCGDDFFACLAMCIPNVCRCKYGYILDEDGVCIPYDQCPTEMPVSTQTTEDPTICLGENQEYTYCGSSCSETCNPSFGSYIACPTVCIPGCFCKDGYVYDEDSGECVLRDDCPTTQTPTCEDENAEYTTCGSYCPGTCDSLAYFDKTACLTVCVEGCFCKEDYVYDADGVCVLKDDCPSYTFTTEAPIVCDPECDSDSGYACVDDDGSGSSGCVLIGDECDGCFRLGMPCGTCPDGINSWGACDGCTWQETYFGDVQCLDTRSECPDEPTEVPLSTLSTEDFGCGENEYYNFCGSACPMKCGDSAFGYCTYQCVAGCFCKHGYVLDEEDGECIPYDECPMGSTEEPDNTEPSDGSTEEPLSTTSSEPTPSPTYQLCGGIASIECDPGYICIDDPSDDCDPDDKTSTDADCSGICIEETTTTTTTTEEPCVGFGCHSDANKYGLIMAFGVIVSVFGWM